MWRKKSIFRHLAMISQLGFSVLASIFLCLFAGYFIDSRFGTKTMVIFLILGTLAGGRNAYLLVRKMLDTELKEDEEERQKQKRSSEVTSACRPKPVSRIRREDTPYSFGKDKEDQDE
ncbi:MAG: AtpZ/AtpI family protein [Lachnospiraceae bacterium]